MLKNRLNSRRRKGGSGTKKKKKKKRESAMEAAASKPAELERVLTPEELEAKAEEERQEEIANTPCPFGDGKGRLAEHWCEGFVYEAKHALTHGLFHNLKLHQVRLFFPLYGGAFEDNRQ